MSNPANKNSISAKLASLDQAVEWFYGEDFSLDAASAKYKEVITLAKDVEQDLKNLKNEIEVLSQDFTK